MQSGRTGTRIAWRTSWTSIEKTLIRILATFTPTNHEIWYQPHCPLDMSLCIFLEGRPLVSEFILFLRLLMDGRYEDLECVYQSCWQNLVSAPLPLPFGRRSGRFEDYCKILGYSASLCTFRINGQYWFLGNNQEVHEIIPLIIGYVHEIPPPILSVLMNSPQNPEVRAIDTSSTPVSMRVT